jgi:elongation factor 1-delta
MNMAAVDCLAYEGRILRFEPLRLKNAESLLYGGCGIAPSGSTTGSSFAPKPSSLVNEISEARKKIEESLRHPVPSSSIVQQLTQRITDLETCNHDIQMQMKVMRDTIAQLVTSVEKLTVGSGAAPSAKATTKPSAAPVPDDDSDDDDDDDVDLFGSDDDEKDESAKQLKEKRLAEYAAKKAKKPGPIAKSSIIFDVKPWDDETDMAEVERLCREISMDGLLWGASKLVPLAYGIKKLQLMCTIEDEKVSVDELQEEMEGFEDHVQSVDIAAFNKV